MATSTPGASTSRPSPTTRYGAAAPASAFLGQKGLDPENWPEAFRKRFGEMPKGIRFL